MTDEQILELAETCGMDDFTSRTEEDQLLKFAQAIYEMGYSNGYSECSFDMGDENV